MSDFKREVSCFLVPKKKVISITTNNSVGSVEFDFFKIWEELKDIEYENVCMIHSHPSGMSHMSNQDWNMVYGWVQAIAKPIYFFILTDKDMTCYLCKRSDENKNKVIRKEVKIISNEKLEIMKNIIYYLSYVEEEMVNDKDLFEIECYANDLLGDNLTIEIDNINEK